MSFRTRLLLAAASLLLATLLWLPTLHLFFDHRDAWISSTSIAPRARQLANQQLHLWSDAAYRAAQVDAMRQSNAEWDFMARGFLAWSLANIALAEPARTDECLNVIDVIIDETLRLEREQSMYHFLMPYASARTYVIRPPRSLFVDSEIALTIGLRLLVADRPEYRPLLRERVAVILDRLAASPLHIAESYPDECWMFDHAVALAAIRVADAVDGADHSAFSKSWIASARAHLTDPATGLLYSSFSLDGRPRDGPEGSSIWMTTHCLSLVDPEFARDQYARARHELSRSICGFGFAREWPGSWTGREDIDSGPIVPILGVSAGSTGLCFVAARTFGDTSTLQRLYTTLEFAGFPEHRDDRLRYLASNPVGDAVMLYGSVLGPAWQRAAAPGRAAE